MGQLIAGPVTTQGVRDELSRRLDQIPDCIVKRVGVAPEGKKGLMLYVAFPAGVESDEARITALHEELQTHLAPEYVDGLYRGQRLHITVAPTAETAEFLHFCRTLMGLGYLADTAQNPTY